MSEGSQVSSTKDIHEPNVRRAIANFPPCSQTRLGLTFPFPLLRGMRSKYEAQRSYRACTSLGRR